MKTDLFSFANKMSLRLTKISILLIPLFTAFHFAAAQIVSDVYKKQIQHADSLYQQEDYKNAAPLYSEAFKVNGNKGLVNDRYHAACSYAMTGNTDSAFYNLFRIAEKAGWNKYELLIADTNLNSLHLDERWNKLVNKVRSNKAITDEGDIK